MTNTSSTEAPARIIWGCPCLRHSPSSISLSIRGTMTAGDTAPTTAPMMAASTRPPPAAGGQQYHAQHLKGSGHEAQQHGGPPGLAQILQLQGQARPGEDDHQGAAAGLRKYLTGMG